MGAVSGLPQGESQGLLQIGDFSRMTYLSVKALRHYHAAGLLEPAAVDPESGYRLYDAAQVRTAQLIRRLRDLEMPLDDIAAAVGARDARSRDEIIAAHLARMEAELERRQATVESLKAILEPAERPVVLREIVETWSLAIHEPVDMGDIEAWWAAAFEELGAAGVHRAGPDGALYETEFFALERGLVTAFVPTASEPRARGRARAARIAGGRFAVTVHTGPFSDLDRAYGRLGTIVTEQAIGADGPIREHYLADRTEVCWPVLPAT